jgi:hypothetical protein
VLAELDRAAVAPMAAPGGGRPVWIIPAGAIAALVLLALLGWLAFGGGSHPASRDVVKRSGGAAGDSVELARGAINAALPSVGCTWLGIRTIRQTPKGVDVALTGVAGDPSVAQSEISRALAAQHLAGATLDFSAVSPITQPGCAALDAYRQIRAPDDATRLSVPQTSFELKRLPPSSAYAGQLMAEAVVNLALADPKRDFTLIGLEPSGIMTTIIANRADLAKQIAASNNGVPISQLGNDHYRMSLDLDHIGWSGLLLISGSGPFDPAVVKPGLGARGADWREKLVSTAAAKGWQADMVWFKSVDEVPD